MRTIKGIGILTGLLAVAVLVASISGNAAVAQGPSFGSPGAVHGGFGAPGAMQPSMGRRTQPRMSYGAGRAPTAATNNVPTQQGMGRINVMGSAERAGNVINQQAGPRTAKQLIQNTRVNPSGVGIMSF